MQSNRLFQIIYILLSKKKVKASELAREFEVSTRTIYRDIDVLSAAGIPVCTDKGRDGGIFLLDNYVLNKSILSGAEQKDILASIRGLRALGYLDEKDLEDKLKHVFAQSEVEWIEVDFANWGEADEDRRKFKWIKQGIFEQRLLHFTYMNSYGQKKERIVEPVQLWFKEKAWYLKAYCRQAEGFRLFKLSRVRQLELLDEYFISKGIPVFTEEEGEKLFNDVQLKLRFKPYMGFRVYDEFKENAIQKLGEEGYEVNIELNRSEWLYGYLLSFGLGVEVIEPIDVRESFKKRLEDMLKQYQ